MSKYEVFSDQYFTVFGLNTGKYGPEKTLYLDTSRIAMNTKTNKSFEVHNVNFKDKN